MKKTIDYSLLVSVIAITLFGAYMILSATYYLDIFDESNNPLSSFINDFEKIALGFVVMVVAIFFNAKVIKKLSPILMLASIVFLVLTLALGKELNGAKRWLDVGAFMFATSELAKLAAILYFAKIFENIKKSTDHYQWALISVLIFGGTTTGLILIQPDLSTAFVYASIIGAMLLVAGGNIKHILMLVLIGGVLVSFVIISEPYRLARFKAFFTDDTELIGTQAQANQSLMAIAEGGVAGVGAGDAYQTKNAQSQAGSDMIFATVAETTGFIGSVSLIITYIFMLWRLTRIAISAESLYAALVTVGVLTMIGLQALIHLAYSTKLIPITGITLPFVSSGGTSIIILLGAIGIVLNFSSNPKGLGSR